MSTNSTDPLRSSQGYLPNFQRRPRVWWLCLPSIQTPSFLLSDSLFFSLLESIWSSRLSPRMRTGEDDDQDPMPPTPWSGASLPLPPKCSSRSRDKDKQQQHQGSPALSIDNRVPLVGTLLHVPLPWMPLSCCCSDSSADTMVLVKGSAMQPATAR